MTTFEIIDWVSGGISIIALLVAGVLASRCKWFDSTDEDDKSNINLIFFFM